MKHINCSFRLSVAFIALMTMMIVPARSQVNMKFGGGIGIISPASNFNGSTLGYYNGSNYGLGNGLTIHGKTKIGSSGLNLVGEINYASLQNTGNSEPGQGLVDISQNTISLKVGPEFHLSIPIVPIIPFIGANIALNRFSGETTFRGVSKVPSATYSVKEATRLGIGFSAGSEVSIGPLLSLDFNFSYNFMNVSGKEWNDVNPETNQRIDSYLSLNDGIDPLYATGDEKHFIGSERSITSAFITISILFGL
ncbi:MAG: outer membrane beta-barrel protein [Bacteroidota bacterium]